MDNIVFFDGITGEFICDATFGEFKFISDLTQTRMSNIVISEDVKIKIGDIWYIVGYFPMSGTVANIDTNTFTKRQEVALYMGQDVYPNDVLMVDNTLIPNITENNGQPYEVHVLGTVEVTGTDNLLGLDVLTRQLMRGEPCRRTMTPTSCGIVAILSPEVIEFRIDDPEISVENIFFADDQFNALRLYNEEDLLQSRTYYIDRDGEVSETRDISLVQHLKSLKVASDEWDSLSYARGLLRTQQYNNEIEFSMPIKNKIGINLDDTILGKEVRVHIEGYIPLNSIISKYEFEDIYTMKLTLGLARSRMSDYINREV